MQNGPRGREADGARTKSLLDNSRHPRNLGLCRFLIGCTSVAHDVGTHRTVRHLRGDIDGSIQPLQRIKVFGKRLPVPGHTLGERAAGNIFHPLHQAHQPLLSIRCRRRKANAAVTHDHGGHAMPRGRRHFLIPGGLTVIVRVDIDKPRRDHASGGVDFLRATLCQITHRDDTVPDNTDVHHFPGSACAIHH